MKLTDEELMAYVDGEPGSASAAIADRQRTGFTAEEVRLLADYRRTRELVRAAFAEVEHEPIPADLTDMIFGQNTANAKLSTTAVKMVPLRRTARPIPPLGYGAMAIAASVVLALAILPFWRAGETRPDPAGGLLAGPVPAASPLAAVLETKPSGVPVAIASNAESPHASHLMVAGTFRDRNARICREVELLDSSLAPRMAAVACRGPADGIWSVEGTAIIANATDPRDSSIVPAGAPETDVLDALLSMLGAKSTLPPDEEHQLLDRGWK